MALSEIIRKLFRLLVTRWNLFTSSFLSFCRFIHSVYVCVCVFLCHLTCYQQRWPESSFLLNISNFMQKKIQVLSMVFPSEGILCSGEMLKHWLCEQSLSIITQFFCWCVIVKHMWWHQISFQLIFGLSDWSKNYNSLLCFNAFLSLKRKVFVRAYAPFTGIFFSLLCSIRYEVKRELISSSQLKLLYFS